MNINLGWEGEGDITLTREDIDRLLAGDELGNSMTRIYMAPDPEPAPPWTGPVPDVSALIDARLEYVVGRPLDIARIFMERLGVREEPQGPAFYADPDAYPYRPGESSALTNARLGLCKHPDDQAALLEEMKAADRAALFPE